MAEQFDHSMSMGKYEEIRFSILVNEYATLIDADALQPQGLNLLYQRLEVGDLAFAPSGELDVRREELLAQLKALIDQRMGPGFTSGFLSIGSQVPDDPSSAIDGTALDDDKR